MVEDLKKGEIIGGSLPVANSQEWQHGAGTWFGGNEESRKNKMSRNKFTTGFTIEELLRKPDQKKVIKAEERHDKTILDIRDDLEHPPPLNLSTGKTERSHLGSGGELPSWIFCTRYSDSCLLYTSPSPRDRQKSRMPSSA